MNTGMLLLILCALLWLGVFGWQAKQAWGLKRQVTQLTLKKQELFAQLEAIQKELGLTVPAGTSPETAALIHNLLGERVLWSEVFKQFARIVPKGLWFDGWKAAPESAQRSGSKAERSAILPLQNSCLPWRSRAISRNPSSCTRKRPRSRGRTSSGLRFSAGSGGLRRVRDREFQEAM